MTKKEHFNSYEIGYSSLANSSYFLLLLLSYEIRLGNITMFLSETKGSFIAAFIDLNFLRFKPDIHSNGFPVELVMCSHLSS